MMYMCGNFNNLVSPVIYYIAITFIMPLFTVIVNSLLVASCLATKTQFKGPFLEAYIAIASYRVVLATGA